MFSLSVPFRRRLYVSFLYSVSSKNYSVPFSFILSKGYPLLLSSREPKRSAVCILPISCVRPLCFPCQSPLFCFSNSRRLRFPAVPASFFRYSILPFLCAAAPGAGSFCVGQLPCVSAPASRAESFLSRRFPVSRARSFKAQRSCSDKESCGSMRCISKPSSGSDTNHTSPPSDSALPDIPVSPKPSFN